MSRARSQCVPVAPETDIRIRTRQTSVLHLGQLADKRVHKDQVGFEILGCTASRQSQPTATTRHDKSTCPAALEQVASLLANGFSGKVMH